MRNTKFEAWFANESGIPLKTVRKMWDGKTYESRMYFIELAWAAWCAALGFIPDAPTTEEEEE